MVEVQRGRAGEQVVGEGKPSAASCPALNAVVLCFLGRPADLPFGGGAAPGCHPGSESPGR